MDTVGDKNTRNDGSEFDSWQLRSANGASIASEKHPERNEDSFLVDQMNETYGVFDGVGGYAGGEIASSAAMRVAARLANEPLIGSGLDAVADHLKETMIAANGNILSITREAATTAVLAKIHWVDGILYATVAHVGDSRAYILHDGVLKVLTVDHTPYRQPGHTQETMARQERLANITDKVGLSGLSVESIVAFNRRNIIGAYLGQDDDVTIDVNHFVIEPGDKIILTSDGVHDNLSTTEMQELLTTVDISDQAHALTDAAKLRARQQHDHIRAKWDDITAVVVNI